MNLMPHNFGGNLVDTLGAQIVEDNVFNTEPYYYATKALSPGDSWIAPDLGSITIYVLNLAPGGTLGCPELNSTIEKGGAIQAEGRSITLKLTGGAATLLVAGVQNSALPASLTAFKHSEFKKVVKPWGHELWINGEHPGYAFKQIFVRASKRLSLQYHRIKSETQLLVNGKARLHYQGNLSVAIDALSASDIATVDLAPIGVNRVSANVLHRIEALTDATIYETSTPHLDDVVRIEDDTNRPDGRIAAEHKVS